MKLTKITNSNQFKVHPVRKNCIFQDGEWWYVGCSDGHRRRLESQLRKNKNRMYVGGKYISKSHPLHKKGHYRDFNSVAFSSMEGYEASTEGYVYVISNPAWQGWYKVGMAVDAWDRCTAFQTSSPFRDYKVEYCKHFKDRRSAEKETHNALLALHIPRKGEWFKATVDQLKNQIQSIKGETHEPIDIST